MKYAGLRWSSVVGGGYRVGCQRTLVYADEVWWPLVVTGICRWATSASSIRHRTSPQTAEVHLGPPVKYGGGRGTPPHPAALQRTFHSPAYYWLYRMPLNGCHGQGQATTDFTTLGSPNICRTVVAQEGHEGPCSVPGQAMKRLFPERVPRV